MQGMATRIAIMTAALTLAAVGFVAVAVFLCMALYGAFEVMLTPPFAALASAGAVLLISIVIILIGAAVARSTARAAKRRAAQTGGPAQKVGGEIGRMLGENVGRYVSSNPIWVLGGAIVAGLAVGASPWLRDFLQNILKRR
jgi:hypothetical protein